MVVVEVGEVVAVGDEGVDGVVDEVVGTDKCTRFRTPFGFSRTLLARTIATYDYALTIFFFPIFCFPYFHPWQSGCAHGARPLPRAQRVSRDRGLAR